MLIYILKSSACLVVFMLFYTFFLEKESMHTFKRFYLLAALALAFGIPLITFIEYVDAPIQVSQLTLENSSIATTDEQNENLMSYFPVVIWSIYYIGVLVFGVKCLFNLSQILFKIKQNPKRKNHGTTHVLLQEPISPHTFFSFIFLNKQKAETRQIPNEVILHEETHAKQKHSVDILITELIQVVFWFNPILNITKKAIKLNHEFLADREVLNKGITPSTYQQILLAFSSDATEPQLANAINYSLIKKRFTIMKTQTSQKNIWLRSLFLLPLLMILLFSFSNKEVIEKEKLDFAIEHLIVNQQKATPEQVAEYNTLAKKFNNMPKDNMIIRSGELKRLKYLYSIMSDKQRKKAEPFPNIPLPPSAPKASKTEMPPRPSAPKAPNTEIPPPPPIPENATPAQKKKYSEAIKNYNYKVAKIVQVKAENKKLNLKKEALVRLKKVQYAENKEKHKLEKIAYKETKAKHVELKRVYKEEQLVKREELKKEKEARKNYNNKVAKIVQVKAENQKLKLKKEELVRLKEVQYAENKEKHKLEKTAYKEAKAKHVELKRVYKEEQLVKRKELKKEKEAYKKAKEEDVKNKSRTKKE